jgi:hypothetical protein
MTTDEYMSQCPLCGMFVHGKSREELKDQKLQHSYECRENGT